VTASPDPDMSGIYPGPEEHVSDPVPLWGLAVLGASALISLGLLAYVAINA
jgi:hypothetical protein